jgi:hypothetical protein
MRVVTRVAAIAWVAVLGCVGLQPSWKFDPDLDLSGRRTFSIAKATAPPIGMSESDAKLWNQRRDLVQKLIRDDLVAKGYREADEKPDLLVQSRVGTGNKAVDSFALRGSFEHERYGTVDIVVADPATGKWLWHGWVTETISEQLDANAEISKAVPLILSKFPPAS